MLFLENFIFWLVGTALVGLGVYLLVGTTLPGVLQFLRGATTLCYIAIGAGSFLFVLGLLGCCGAAYHNDCLLRSYIFVLVLFILAEIGIGLYIGLGFGTDQLTQIWNSSDENSKDVIHVAFKCCGFHSPTESYPTGVPNSCFDPAAGDAYMDGCYSKLVAAISNLDIILICVGASVALLEILGILMACFLACNGKQHSENQVGPLQLRRGIDNAGYR